MNNFFIRAITGVVFVSALVLSIAFGPWTFFAMFFTIASLAMREFYKLSKVAGAKPQAILGTVSGLYLFTSLFLFVGGYTSLKPTLGLIPMVGSLFIFELYRKSENPFRDLAFTILGIVYIAGPISLFNFFVFPPELGGVANSSYSPHILIGLFIFIWANDTGAYLCGSTFGKRRLFERISPKKSWEGSIGGGIFALIIAGVLSHFFHQINTIDMLVIALITVVAGNFGDLVESLFKRSISIKDSGSIFPGHGGLLDRFDSILLATPFVYFYLRLVA